MNQLFKVKDQHEAAYRGKRKKRPSVMTVPDLILSQPQKNEPSKIDRNWNTVCVEEELELKTLPPPTDKCGFGSFKPLWLQGYGTKKIFLLAFMLLSVVQGMVWSYFTATLSTVQKRFKISSETTGIVMTGSEISQMLFSILVSYYGARAHRTRWMAFGVFLNAISCFAIAAGHFIYGSGRDALNLTKEYSMGDSSMFQVHPSAHSTPVIPQAGTSENGAGALLSKVALCHRTTDDAGKHGLGEEMSLAPMVLLFMALFVHGIGGLFLWTLGGPYLDDNSKRKSLPMLFGTTSSLRLIGPTFGFMLASFSLKMYVNPLLTPTVSQGDPRFIGAWWFGWVVIGTMLLIFSFIIALFPRKLRRGSVDHTGDFEPKHKHLPPLSELPTALKRLLKNKIVISNNLAGIFFCFSGMSYWTYMPKYIETIFFQTAANASIISGIMSIVSNASGLMASGYLISKYQFSARQLAGWNTITGFIHGMIILYFVTLGCDGGNFSFGSRKLDGTFSPISPCNTDCHCEVSKIMPVCYADTKTVFYSACHAGCESYDEATKTMSNCACLPDPKAKVSVGNCAEPEGCWNIFFTFLVVNSIIKFFDSTGRIGNMLISYRCVRLEERELSIGLHIALLSAFAFIPAPIVFGRIIDSVCLVWGGGGGVNGRGNCMLYDGKQLRYVFNVVAAGLIFICVFFDWCVWYYVKGLDLYKEPDNEKDQYEKEELLPKDE